MKAGAVNRRFIPPFCGAADTATGGRVSDMAMPGRKGGLDLGRAIRASHPNMPVLLITGYSIKAREGVKEGFAVLKSRSTSRNWMLLLMGGRTR
jgi:hypothetical protein